MGKCCLRRKLNDSSAEMAKVSVSLSKQADLSNLVVADYLHQGAYLPGQFRLRAESVPGVTPLLTEKGGVTIPDFSTFISLC